jgi:hypothetical protein
MGPIRYPKTSVKDYHSTLRDTPERTAHIPRKSSFLAAGRLPKTQTEYILLKRWSSFKPETSKKLNF